MIGIKEPVSIEDQVYSKILSSQKKKKRRTSPNLVEIIGTGVISVVILLFAFGAAYYYNAFILWSSDIDTNYANIETQLQKRKNLSISLGKTVTAYTKHERAIFMQLGELRAAVSGGGDSKSLMDDIRRRAEGNEALSALLSKGMGNGENTLSGLMAIAEQYPDLKLSENFRTLMTSITESEGKLAELRFTYNNSINEYTNVKDTFPGLIFKFIFKPPDYEYFKPDEDVQKLIPFESDAVQKDIR